LIFGNSVFSHFLTSAGGQSFLRVCDSAICDTHRTQRPFSTEKAHHADPAAETLRAARHLDDPKRLINEIAAWERQRNTAGTRIKWMFTTDKARAKMGRAYPVTSKES